MQAQTAIKEGEEININYVPFIQVLELFSQNPVLEWIRTFYRRVLYCGRESWRTTGFSNVSAQDVRLPFFEFLIFFPVVKILETSIMFFMINCLLPGSHRAWFQPVHAPMSQVWGGFLRLREGIAVDNCNTGSVTSDLLDDLFAPFFLTENHHFNRRVAHTEAADKFYMSMDLLHTQLPAF